MKDKKINRNKQAEHQRKHLAQFDGSYVYYILDRRTQQIVYVGESGNIVNRYYDHYHRPTLKSGFGYWCIENNEDVANYKMVVLDLTNVEELDFDDRLLVEKVLQYYHAETIVNKRIPDRLMPYEIERFEYICSIIDFEFKSYMEVKVLKMTNKKALSTPIDKA